MSSLAEVLLRLRSPQWVERCAAVHELAAFDDPRAKSALADALYDSGDSAVTEAAVDAIIATDDEWFFDALVEALIGARPDLSDEAASEVAEDVGSRLAGLQEKSALARRALARAEELDPPVETTLADIQERHRRWLDSQP